MFDESHLTGGLQLRHPLRHPAYVVVEDGELDVSDEVLEQSEIVLMAVHSFPADVNRYFEAVRTALANPGVDIWAHPGQFLVKNGLTLSRLQAEEIFDTVCRNNVLIELNSRYGMPPKDWRDMLKGKARFVRGDDVHSVTELKKRT